MTSSQNDFDFLIGKWTVHHRRLAERLAGCNEWVEFKGTTDVSKILGGYGNMDDNHLELPSGHYRAVSLRAFDPETTKWAIWWLDSRTPHALDVPVIGSFAEGIGTFFAEDTFQGKPIKIRFQWSIPEPDRPRWEQAFSPDGGATWETNWIMDFTRRAG
jgi:hypothetical protein